MGGTLLEELTARTEVAEASKRFSHCILFTREMVMNKSSNWPRKLDGEAHEDIYKLLILLLTLN